MNANEEARGEREQNVELFSSLCTPLFAQRNAIKRELSIEKKARLISGCIMGQASTVSWSRRGRGGGTKGGYTTLWVM
jgi:hypothetical protein